MTPAIISGGIFTLSNSITAQMYLLSFYNLEPYRLYNLSDNQMYVQKIKSSHEYNEFLGSISDILEGLYHQMFGDWSKWRKTGTIAFEYDSHNLDSQDLYYSIHNANIDVQITFFSKSTKPNTFIWKIDVLLSDTYNFEYWDETHGNTLSRFINNNFGFNFQRSHRITPYVWIINFVYYEEYTIRYIPVWW